MRCLSCNCQLNDQEATRKYASSRLFVDLCNRCFGHVEDDIHTLDGISSEDRESGETYEDNL
jgi:hypothetical protein